MNIEAYVFCNVERNMWYFKKYKEQLGSLIPMFDSKQEAINYKHEYIHRRNLNKVLKYI